jgi:hypothetical protein
MCCNSRLCAANVSLFPSPPCGKLIYEKPDENKRLDFECPALYPKSFQNPAASCTSCRNIEKNGDAVELAGVGIIDTGADHDGGVTRARDLTAKEIRCRPVSPPRTSLKESRELLQGAEERAEQLALEGSRDHSAAWLSGTHIKSRQLDEFFQMKKRH